MIKYFRCSASTWWNDADSKIKFPPNISHISHCELVNCVKSTYLRCVFANDLCVLFCIVLCCICMFNSSGKEERLMPITQRIVINQINQDGTVEQ